MWLFMLDMIKEQNKRISASAEYIQEMRACLAEQPNITLTSAWNAIWEASRNYSFIYPVPQTVCLPGTALVSVPSAVHITNMVFQAGI